MEIRRNEAATRYELVINDEVIGRIDYVDEGSVIDMPHTEVDPAHGGQGYAARLAEFALDDVRARGKLVRPTCPYLARYIDNHEEYGDLLEG